MMDTLTIDMEGLDAALRGWLTSDSDILSDHTTSASSDTSSDHETTPQKPTKKRKATYYQRKDEIDELKEEATKLEDELRRLTPITGQLHDVYGLRGLFQTDIERNNLRLAGVQAMLSAKLPHTPALIPLATHIHLPKADARRFEVLESLRASKLESALQFMVERTRNMDLRQYHRNIQLVDYPGGDFAFSGLEIIPFTGGHSVRQVFDEFVFYGAHQEMSVTEMVGMLTIREGGELEDIQLGQTRLVAKVTDELVIESNAAIFSSCVDATDETPAYAISTLDSIDEDELYPYQPETRGCKEIVAAVMFSEVETPTGRLVTMSKWSHVRFRMPRVPLSEELEDTLRESMMQWCDVIPQVIQERLAMRVPAP